MTAPGGPGAAAVGCASLRGGVRAGCARAFAGSAVAPSGRATTGGHSGQQVRQGARLRVDSTNSRNCLLIALLFAG